MSRGRRIHGKKLSALELGATICQILAIIVFVPIFALLFNANKLYGDVKEYLPVTVTYNEVNEYTVKDSDGDTQIRYRCNYQYEVDGKIYYGDRIKYSSVEVGSQEIIYYNPQDPNYVSNHPNAKSMLDDITVYIVICVLLQTVAIYIYILLLRKKIKKKEEDKAYEKHIRQDVERNIEKYKGINIPIDHQRAYEILEPLRQSVQKSKKKVKRLEHWLDVAVSGNIIIVLIYVVLRMIAKLRIQKARDVLYSEETRFYKEYKKMLAEPVLNHLFEDYRYLPSQGFSADELIHFKLSRESFRFASTEDLIEGYYKGIHYRQADVKRENVFAGRVSVYDFKKSLNGEIVIADKGNEKVASGGLKKVEMESVLFNKRFDVYASNPHIAYYILTPQFMERMLELYIRGEFVLRMVQNNIYILRNDVNGIFEPDINRPIDVKFEIGKSYTELKEILEFIDIMNLEQTVESIHLNS